MPPIRLRLRPTTLLSHRATAKQPHRHLATESRPPPQKPQSRAGTFYKSFGSPVLKCFLGALFTYQVVYWGWLKLEVVEERRDVEDEIRGLKEELRVAVLERRALAKEDLGEGKDKDKVEGGGRKGWW